MRGSSREYQPHVQPEGTFLRTMGMAVCDRAFRAALAVVVFGMVRLLSRIFSKSFYLVKAASRWTKTSPADSRGSRSRPRLPRAQPSGETTSACGRLLPRL